MFFCSVAFHFCVIAAPFGRLTIPPAPQEPEIEVQTEVDRPALLPRVERIEEEKVIKQVEEPPPVREESQPVREEPVPPAPEEASEPAEDKKVVATVPDTEPVPDAPAEKPVKRIDPGAPTGDTERESIFRYRDAVKQRIEAARRYPKAALRRGIEGTAVVFFTILPDGSARDVHIVRSSGSGLLDSEVVATVRRASPFPPTPDGHTVEIRVPVVFSLE
jgi:protein TonB